MEPTDYRLLVTLCNEADPQITEWIKIGLLPKVTSEQTKSFVATFQHERLHRLATSPFRWEIGPQLPDDLFTPPIVAPIGSRSCLTQGAGLVQSAAESLWMQLLPLWVDSVQGRSNGERSGSWNELDLNRYRLYSLDSGLIERARHSRQRQLQLAASRSGLFARSANYMGSKAVLAGQLLDIVEALEAPDTTLVDLMCGSGAMAGAFARHYPTVASDAQEFCMLLGLIQGGGMTRARSVTIAEQVIQDARRLYHTLTDQQLKQITDEDQLLNSELSQAVHNDVVRGLQARASIWEQDHLGSETAVIDAWEHGMLLSHLYAGVYFGYRQAAELDCLRQAIEALHDESDRRWALGALVCAASACAYTYGGHFAQPKLDISLDGKQRGDLAEALQQRSLSVTHEFFVRFTSLADESEQVKHQVKLVAGPWQTALETLARHQVNDQICVYVDPPYTRDEYSRYYHVLEAIVRYQPQAVSGKGRLPKRGSPGRFASSFSGRRPDVMEREIAKALQACLANGWNCLWSYSSAGTASITGTLAHLEGLAHSADIFQMPHSYKAQGKRGAKQVLEYAVHLRPRKPYHLSVSHHGVDAIEGG